VERGGQANRAKQNGRPHYPPRRGFGFTEPDPGRPPIQAFSAGNLNLAGVNILTDSPSTQAF
jgi:hypothetical protein